MTAALNPLPVPDLSSGLCREVDPDMHYPEKGGNGNQAKAICRRCPVIAECLEYSLDNREEEGIWGGLGPRERRRLYLRRGDYVCGQCDSRFANIRSLGAHVAAHTRNRAAS